MDKKADNHTANVKTILSRDYIFKTCKSDGTIEMLPIVVVMATICVLGTIFISPSSGAFERYAILLLWLIGIITVVIQFVRIMNKQQAIKEALPLGYFKIYLARSKRRRYYSCHFEIEGKDRKVAYSTLGQMRLLGEEDVYILMINDKITALYPAKKFALDEDLFGKMTVVHPLQEERHL